jgi:hypothetical protein
LEVIRTWLAVNLSARQARAIPRLAESRNAQVLTLTCILCDELQSEWSMRDTGPVFYVNMGIIHRIRTKEMRYLEAGKERLTLLRSDQDNPMIEQTNNCFPERLPVSPNPVRVFISEMFDI